MARLPVRCALASLPVVWGQASHPISWGSGACQSRSLQLASGCTSSVRRCLHFGCLPARLQGLWLRCHSTWTFPRVAAVPLLCCCPVWHPPQHPAGQQSLWQSPGCSAAVPDGHQQPQTPCVPTDCQPGSPAQASCLLDCTLEKCPGSRVTGATLTLHSTMPARCYEGVMSAPACATTLQVTVQSGPCLSSNKMLRLASTITESQNLWLKLHARISLSLRRLPDQCTHGHTLPFAALITRASLR